ncbi:MAG: hypothetical protein HC831_13100 [Chloroflexia bacterium]|nr:hypothetical protein [Chloroflexia bacterium]
MINLTKPIAIFFTSLLFCGCSMKSQSENTSDINNTLSQKENTKQPEYVKFNRDSIKAKLKYKKAKRIPLVVHVFVPLCDNEHQGIVPVGKSLGDGMNLKTNLYWGAGYGIKTHFKRNPNWKLVSEQKNIDTNILERVIFEKTYHPSTKVILVADAYRGDRMGACLRDYFNSLAGIRMDTIYATDSTFNLAKIRDLLIFNGHNGLMDIDMEWIDNEDDITKDAAVISCLSANWFMERLRYLKAYPLVTTLSLLPPEAYIAEGIIDAWAMEKKKKKSG